MRSVWLFSLLLGIFIALNLLDAHSTATVVKLTSYRSEKNPLARWVIKRLGPVKGVAAVKSILGITIPLMVWYFMHKPRDINLLLIFADILYLAVVVNNYRLVRRCYRRGLR